MRAYVEMLTIFGPYHHIRKEVNLNNILNDPIKASNQLTGAHSPSVCASPNGVPGGELRAALLPPRDSGWSYHSDGLAWLTYRLFQFIWEL